MPATHTRFFVSSHTPSNVLPAASSVCCQLLPSKWSVTPSSPTAHTSFDARSATPDRLFGVGLLNCAQVLPSQWRIVPSLPTAHTSRALLPQIEVNECCVTFFGAVGGVGSPASLEPQPPRHAPS